MRCFVVAALISVTSIAAGHGDLHDSINRLTEKIAAAPSDPAYHILRAGLYLAHEDYSQAAADYDRAEVMKGDLSAIRLGRGKLLLASGKLEEAIASLDLLLATGPLHVDALATRARALVRKGEPLAAAAGFSAAITAATAPEPEFYLERAQALAGATPPRYDEAICGLDEGLSRLGASVITLQLAAVELEEKALHTGAALARIDRMTNEAPRKESWLVLRGDLLRRLKRPDDARRAYTGALTCIAALPLRARATGACADIERRARRALGELAQQK